MITHYLYSKINASATSDADAEKLDLLMMAIKAVRANGGTADPKNLESIEKQRRSQEKLSKLFAPAISVQYEKSILNKETFSTMPIEKGLFSKDTDAFVEGTADNKEEEQPTEKEKIVPDSIKHADNELPIEWARPEFAHRTDRIYLYCHGGGYTCGGLGYSSVIAGKLALHTGLEVLSFQYRLAPENPFPAAIEDVLCIWNYLMFLGYGADDIFVVGDSAGGNLALELVLKLKEQNRKLPRGLVLMSPWTDMTISSSAYEEYKELDPMLTKEYIEGVRFAYAGEQNFEEPQFSPLFADLSDLPPTLIQVGSNEILRADSEGLYEKLKEKECVAKLIVYPGCWHVFQQMPTPKTVQAFDDIREFISTII